MTFSCSANTELYRSLFIRCKDTLNKVSLSFQDDSIDSLVLLNELKGSYSMKFLKLNFSAITPETLDVIASMPNLSILTGLRLRTEVEPYQLTEVLEGLRKLKKLKIDCSEQYI